jgi:hypothetical protein
MTGQFHCRIGSQIEWHPVIGLGGKAVAVWLIVHVLGEQLRPVPAPYRRFITRTIEELHRLDANIPDNILTRDVIKNVEFYEYDPLTYITAEYPSAPGANDGPPGGAGFDLDPLYAMSDMFVDNLPGNPGAGVRGDAKMPYPVYGWLHLYWGPASMVDPGPGDVYGLDEEAKPGPGSGSPGSPL